LMIRFVFWACCSSLLYVYVFYPLLVRMLAARFGVPVLRGERLPSVTIIVTVYNEEKSIRAKLDNLAALDYPRELFDILVVSDASSDATEQIAANYKPGRVRVIRLEGRQGKTACQNAAAAAASGEILVFTDATTRLQADALCRLVENFADPRVGCVGGCLAYVTDVDNVTGRGNEIYWSYELRLRAGESLLGNLIGVSGCLYAVRGSAYRCIDPTLISDFVIAMRMREQGLRTVLAHKAACFEATLERSNLELSMRVRVAIRSLNALVQERRFLNPLRFGCFAWQLWSHKVLRYASPLFWIGALASNLVLVEVYQAPWPYQVVLLVQIALLAAGTVGFILQNRYQRLGILEKPYYFLLSNVAALIAALRYARGERMITWNPMRGPGGTITE
jgi:cellulose synthase/poly-beta-1,6-N-acetylglucosamine synthase-like glycosyltransferase